MNTPSRPARRRALARAANTAALIALCGLALPASAQADNYPDRTVRIVLPFPPGTVNDTVLRLLADGMSAQWKQPVVVENKPGASSMIGTAQVAQAPADGYTLLANISLILQNPALRSKLTYDPKAIMPVTEINRQQLAIFVRADLPIHSLQELIAYAKERPGKVNFASWGIGSTAHLIREKFQIDQGVDMAHVPYKGGQEINRAVAAGEADVGVADFLSPMPLVRSGKLRIIGTTGPARMPAMPQAQTLAEAGVKGFESYNWFSLFAPAGTPASVVQKIAETVHAVQDDPALLQRFREEMLVYPVKTTPEEFAKIYERERQIWTQIAEQTGLRLD